jgi:glycosyltransferase involved in cell wall biosynthesis
VSANPPPRLTLFSTSFLKGHGGAEKTVHDLASRLVETGVATSIVADRPATPRSRNPYFAALPAEVGVRAVRLPNPLLGPLPTRLRNLVRYAWGCLELFVFFARHKPDVVHLHLVNVDVLVLALYRKVFRYRLLLTFTGLELELAASSWLSRVKLRLALRAADAATAVSTEIAQRLERAYGPVSVRVVPNGVELPEEEADPPPIGATTPRFVYVGRLAPVKRLPLLLKAFRICTERDVPGELVLVGTGEEEGEIAEWIEQSGLAHRISMRGALPHNAALAEIGNACCLLLASSSEGCPLAVLEAMARGKPVVAPDVGGLRELIRDGEHGLLYPAGDLDALADAIAAMAGSPAMRVQLGKNGAARARREFSLDRMVESYTTLYRQLA